MNELRKSILILVILGICSLLSAQVNESPIQLDNESYRLLYNDTAIRIIYSGDIELLNKPLNIFCVGRLNYFQLKILRNTIYAKYGYEFKSGDMKNYFLKCPWYKVNTRFSESMFNDTDKYNLQLINSFEANSLKGYIDQIDTRSMIGVWQETPEFADGWGDRFEFHGNGTLIWYASQMNSSKRLLKYIGKWNISNNCLTYSIENIEYIKDGSISINIENYMGYTIINGNRIQIRLPNPEIYYFSIGNLQLYEKNNVKKSSIEIANEKWFKMSEDPDVYK